MTRRTETCEALGCACCLVVADVGGFALVDQGRASSGEALIHLSSRPGDGVRVAAGPRDCCLGWPRLQGTPLWVVPVVLARGGCAGGSAPPLARQCAAPPGVGGGWVWRSRAVPHWKPRVGPKVDGMAMECLWASPGPGQGPREAWWVEVEVDCGGQGGSSGRVVVGPLVEAENSCWTGEGGGSRVVEV